MEKDGWINVWPYQLSATYMNRCVLFLMKEKYTMQLMQQLRYINDHDVSHDKP